MIYAYIRISDKKQSYQRQQHRFQKFLQSRNLGNQKITWIEETVSGKKSYQKRDLNKIMLQAKPGDTIITDELSRLSRTSLEIFEILSKLTKMKVSVYIIEQNFEFQDDLQSQVFAFAFSLAAQIERQLIVSRTKAGLAAAKAKGKILGRPPGATNKNHKLDPHQTEIKSMRQSGIPISRIAKTYNVHRNTMSDYLKRLEV
jgi:DNA invertase Pin-like site-specific DNA recombinase